jgi:hypothetical protein
VKKLALAATVAALSVFGAAQDRLSVRDSISNNGSGAFVGYRIAPLPGLFGTNVRGDLWLLGGVRRNTLAAGFGITAGIPISKNSNFIIGAAFAPASRKKEGLALIVGYEVRL